MSTSIGSKYEMELTLATATNFK